MHSAKWIASAVVLCGLTKHHCLDTKRHWCNRCKKRFARHAKKTMQLDQRQFIGQFNFHLATGHAVDDDLCSFVVNSATKECAAAITKRCKQLATANYINDHCLCLNAVGANEVKSNPSHRVSHDPKQRCIAAMLPAIGEANTNNPNRRKKDQAMDRLCRAKMGLESAEAAVSADPESQTFLSKKKNHNNIGA